MGTSCLLENLVTAARIGNVHNLAPRLACHLRSTRGWRCCVPQPLHLQLQTHLYSYSLQGCELHFARWLGEVRIINGKSVPCCDFLESLQYFFSVWSALWHWDISPNFLASTEVLEVRDLKLYRASQQRACASQEAWYLASIISFLGSYLYFVFFFYTDCL